MNLTPSVALLDEPVANDAAVDDLEENEIAAWESGNITQKLDFGEEPELPVREMKIHLAPRS